MTEKMRNKKKRKILVTYFFQSVKTPHNRNKIVHHWMFQKFHLPRSTSRNKIPIISRITPHTVPDMHVESHDAAFLFAIIYHLKFFG